MGNRDARRHLGRVEVNNLEPNKTSEGTGSRRRQERKMTFATTFGYAGGKGEEEILGGPRRRYCSS